MKTCNDFELLEIHLKFLCVIDLHITNPFTADTVDPDRELLQRRKWAANHHPRQPAAKSKRRGT